jgi:mannose-6-phosphate isomerase-like protein (cupin superfamily)
MTVLLLLTLLQATPPTPAPAPAKPAATTTQKPRAASGNLSLALFVTDSAGRNIEGVKVTLMGPVDREMTTPGGTALRIPNLRAGTYRARFEGEGFYTFEKEIVIRAGTPAEVSVTLNAAPPPPPPPPPPAPATPEKPASPAMPPPGMPKTVSLPDYIEKNFITNREPQKQNEIGCSGLEQALLWQVREPWTSRQHDNADGMLYVVGGDGRLKLGEREFTVAAGAFIVVPRGTSYSLSRSGRNPLIVLAVLAGAPCAG